MPVLQNHDFLQRHLPHWQPEGAEFFITFRLAGSLPIEAVNRLQDYKKQLQSDEQDDQKKIHIQRKIFQKYEGPSVVREPCSP